MSSDASFQLQSKMGLGSDHSDLIVLIVRYFRIVAMVCVVWFIGYFNFSISWVLIAVLVYLLRQKKMSERAIKSEMIKAIGINEKDAIMARVDEVPSWVYFPDRERSEWLNKILKQLWPNLRVYLSNVLIEQVEPIINQYSMAFIGKMRFDEVDLGDIAPRVGGVKVYTENVPNEEIIIDLEVLYAGDAQIKMGFRGIVAGVKDFRFQGDFRFILKPLSKQVPFFENMVFFLLKMPKIDFNLTQLANTFDMPGIRKLIDSTIEDAISKTLVLPNRIVIPLIPDFNVTELDSMKTLKPRGILRCHVIKARNLKNADISLFSKSKSDPYVKISGLGMPKLTKVVNNDLNPVWNETFDFIIDEITINPTLLFEVFDKDDINDDFLGKFDINVERIFIKRNEEGFYKLKNVTHGELYLRFEWYFLSSNKIRLSHIRKLKEFGANQATCLLLIDLKSANELPFAIKKGGGLSEPDPRVVLMVRDCQSTSSAKPRTTNPKWNENHYFFINNPEDEQLVCKIEDEKTKTTIAYCDLPVLELLNEEDLTVDRKFDLNCMQAGYLPKLSMKLTLRILSPYKENEYPNGPEQVDAKTIIPLSNSISLPVDVYSKSADQSTRSAPADLLASPSGSPIEVKIQPVTSTPSIAAIIRDANQSMAKSLAAKSISVDYLKQEDQSTSINQENSTTPSKKDENNNYVDKNNNIIRVLKRSISSIKARKSP